LRGKIIGALDAPIFAPGLVQGPLDVEAIRKVDAGMMTANEAFTRGGILAKMGLSSLEECSAAEKSYALQTLSLFAAMEIAAMIILMRDLGEPRPDLFLAGSPSPIIRERVSELLGRDVKSLERFSAAKGCACIAEDVFKGRESILGLAVDEGARFKGAKVR